MTKATNSYKQVAINYAKDVIKENIPACEFVKSACNRFLNDLKRVKNKTDLLEFDDFQAERWCNNLEMLPHVKGKWAAQKQRFKLSPWQVFCTVNIYGFMINGKRRFREAYIEVPRKNGKTFFVAGLGCGALTWENEFGAEIYCGATTEKQAYEVYTPARNIFLRTEKLRAKYGVECTAKSTAITIPSNGSKFETIIGNPGDGASPSLGIADEFHEHKSSDQVDTLVTGMGAREQPLMIYITTAGADMGGPCYEKRQDIIQILKGTVQDDSIFGIIYTIDESDQWDTVDAQIKANPNYGISVDQEFLNGQLQQARRSALKQVAYKTKHLNMWVGAKAAWMNMLAFQACRKKDLTLDDYQGCNCYIGIDLASKIDIASMAILFPPETNNDKWSCFVRHYLPEETILNNNRYKAWHAEGWVISTPGNAIDFEYIEDDLKQLAKKHQIIEIPFDPYQATQFSMRMLSEGLPLIEVGATVKNFSEPMKYLEALILEKKILFELDPVLLWMFGNVVAKLDAKDNILPRKERVENKIDGVVAAIMALNRAMLKTETGSLDQFLSDPIFI